jgi:hypothetical protein
MAKKYDIEGFRKQLLKIVDKKKLGKAVMTPLRKGQRDIAGEVISHYWQHKLGRIIWEWRKEAFGVKSGPIVFTRKKYRTRWSSSQEAYIAQIHVEGMAALIQQGGKLRKHVIFGKAERTPGVIVSRKPALIRIRDQKWPGIVRDVEISFAKFVDRTL